MPAELAGALPLSIPKPRPYPRLLFCFEPVAAQGRPRSCEMTTGHASRSQGIGINGMWGWITSVQARPAREVFPGRRLFPDGSCPGTAQWQFILSFIPRPRVPLTDTPAGGVPLPGAKWIYCFIKKKCGKTKRNLKTNPAPSAPRSEFVPRAQVPHPGAVSQQGVL